MLYGNNGVYSRTVQLLRLGSVSTAFKEKLQIVLVFFEKKISKTYPRTILLLNKSVTVVSVLLATKRV